MAKKKKQEGALSGYRILDLADAKGVYCTKLLADLGADVIKIEKPEGDSMRKTPPFVDDVPLLENSLYFLYRNANKRGITLNLETCDGKAIFKKLVKTADVVVETFTPGYMASLGLDYPALRKISPGLIMDSVTEFGQTGPYRDWKGSNIVDFALSGVMITSGFPGNPPCLLPGTPAYDATSLIAAISIIAALYNRGITSQGQYIDTSVHESARLGLYPWLVVMYSYALTEGGPPPTVETRMGAAVYPVYPCKDGFIRVVALTPWQWKALVRVLGEPEVLRMPEWQEFLYRIANADALYALMVEFTTKYTMTELLQGGQREGVPIVPIYGITDFATSPQTKARQFFTEVSHPVIGKALYPGSPYKLTETPTAIRRPAPCLGQHNEEIYCKELGFSKEDLVLLRYAGVL